MSAFVDSSGLVKRYADEPGSDLVRSLPFAVVSQVTRVEVPAALWRKHRGGSLGAADTRALVAEFEADFFGTADAPGAFVPVAATAEQFDAAARLCAIHALRALDALQLAAALAARSVDPGVDTMIVYDERLATAAAAEGFAVLPS